MPRPADTFWSMGRSSCGYSLESPHISHKCRIVLKCKARVYSFVVVVGFLETALQRLPAVSLLLLIILSPPRAVGGKWKKSTVRYVFGVFFFCSARKNNFRRMWWAHISVSVRSLTAHVTCALVAGLLSFGTTGWLTQYHHCQLCSSRGIQVGP
jgi:hypothetical protein